MAERTVVLVGGGHAHAILLRRWAQDPAPNTRLVLLSPDRYTPYSGMLPGHVAGHYDWADFHVDLAPLVAAAGGELVLDRAVGLDLAGGGVRRAAGPEIGFELCSLDIGSTSEPPTLPGADEHLFPVKPIAPFLAAWEGLLARPGGPRAAVLGAGVGGVELALAMAFRLRREGRDATVTLIERDAVVARELPLAARRRLRHALAALGVSVRTQVEAAAFDAGGIVTDAGERIAADFVTAAAGARAARWLAETGLALGPEGFVAVDAHLRSLSDPRVFAVGDTAHLTHAPRPKAGVFAVRQGPVLHAVLRAVLAGEPPPRYEPQADYLRLVSLGAKRALAVRFGRAVGGSGIVGAALWRLKDRIDRRFMASLAEPERARPA